jgi:hypothetical protein
MSSVFDIEANIPRSARLRNDFQTPALLLRWGCSAPTRKLKSNLNPFQNELNEGGRFVRSSGKRFSWLLTAAAAAAFLISPTTRAHAQISVQIGPAPVCPYGYFDYPPYQCAPYGYYGPQWFRGGIFLGAGPWFRGPEHFHGYVDRHYDPRFGYRGGFPRRGERDRWDRDHWANHPHGSFHGNEMRDGRGHSEQGGGHEHGGDHEHGHPH